MTQDPLDGSASRLGDDLRRDVAEFEVQLEEAVLREEALRLTGRDDAADDAEREQQELLADLEHHVQQHVADAFVTREAERVVAASELDGPEHRAPVADDHGDHAGLGHRVLARSMAGMMAAVAVLGMFAVTNDGRVGGVDVVAVRDAIAEAVRATVFDGPGPTPSADGDGDGDTDLDGVTAQGTDPATTTAQDAAAVAPTATSLPGADRIREDGADGALDGVNGATAGDQASTSGLLDELLSELPTEVPVPVELPDEESDVADDASEESTDDPTDEPTDTATTEDDEAPGPLQRPSDEPTDDEPTSPEDAPEADTSSPDADPDPDAPDGPGVFDEQADLGLPSDG